MPECPACFGDGRLDLRDVDRLIESTWTPEEIRTARAAGMRFPSGIVPCDECEGTGVVSEERLRDLAAATRASVDQALARYLAEQRRPVDLRDVHPSFDPWSRRVGP